MEGDMSSLIFEITDNSVAVAVDTMCVDELGSFRGHVSKAFAIPHLQVVIAGTGVLDVIERFFIAINSSSALNHDELAEKSGDLLAEIWEDWKQSAEIRRSSDGEAIGDPGITTTVFQFGFSHAAGRYEAVQYHSGEGFRAERIPRSDNLFYKPPAPLLGEKQNGIAEIARIMLSQRAHESSKPASKRIHIGGDILLLCIDQQGVTIRKVYSFAD